MLSAPGPPGLWRTESRCGRRHEAGTYAVESRLRKSLDIEPGHLTTQVAYGMTWLRDRADPSMGIAVLERAAPRPPRDSGVVLGLFNLYVQKGDTAQIRARRRRIQ